MDRVALSRLSRDLESRGLFGAAAEVWARALPDESLGPAVTSDGSESLSPSLVLESALRDAEALGDTASVSRLLGALAGLERPSRSAA